jgi:hypothetical protein
MLLTKEILHLFYTHKAHIKKNNWDSYVLQDPKIVNFCN